ncbi:hypothetical protein T07_9006 [Trichinella nelsoni]|uniref:Uncharacterized protein n=1 Tax=Trichinella nelsoni TaxID=6336 RepID=A0A0V0S0Q7_9BILA|nr:hypothetical protein T07_9006 [Trichinella nelsoni]
MARIPVMNFQDVLNASQVLSPFSSYTETNKLLLRTAHPIHSAHTFEDSQPFLILPRALPSYTRDRLPQLFVTSRSSQKSAMTKKMYRMQTENLRRARFYRFSGPYLLRQWRSLLVVIVEFIVAVAVEVLYRRQRRSRSRKQTPKCSTRKSLSPSSRLELQKSPSTVPLDGGEAPSEIICPSCLQSLRSRSRSKGITRKKSPGKKVAGKVAERPRSTSGRKSVRNKKILIKSTKSRRKRSSLKSTPRKKRYLLSSKIMLD